MNDIAVVVFGYAVAYLLGSIPFGFILGKFAGVGDIRTIGSGNIGATNMLRTGRKGVAAATLALDALKGYAAVCLVEAYFLYAFYNAYSWKLPLDLYLTIYFAGFAAILGHIFPLWLGFKGGKGVATAIGTFFAVDPLIGIIVCVVWLFTFLVSRTSSLAALAAFVITTVIVVAFFAGNGYSLYVAVVTLTLIITHRDNIRRLLKGEEHKWSKV
jgi:glycerol-3-phosphate acyltransferase PlsY